MTDSCKLNVKQKYISVGCNRNPLCLDWGFNGLVAFGASNSVALYQPEDNGSGGKINYVLCGHKDKVNCVKWIPKEGQGRETELVSGSIDSGVLIWRSLENKWVQCDSLKGHNGSVIAVAAITVLNDVSVSKTVVATASADSTVKIWQRKSLEVPVLACGCEDTTVNLYTETDSMFVHVLKLVGHEDWIRSVDFVDIDCGDLMLASSSQDSSVRVWRIVREQRPNNLSFKTQNTTENATEDLMLTSNKFTQTCKGTVSSFSVVLETILNGHEGWVYGVRWHPKISQDSGVHQPLCLMSSSMDKTIILWSLDEQSGLWIDEVRVGDVGGNTLGFYGSVFSPDGKNIVAYSYQGALHMWRKQTDEKKKHTWGAVVTTSGHFGPVQDIAWDPEGGEFLLSLSSDQTTRIHAPWRRRGHEVIRVFDAPKTFIEMFGFLRGIKDENVNKCSSLGASVPVLGLSNKAVFDDDLENLKNDLKDPQRPMKASAFASEEPSPFTLFVSDGPPTENNLLQNTLWPESQKLYGHGYEIFSLAYNASSNILASSCKASKVDQANILLWDTLSWKIVGSLEAHSLTITQMEFSSSGKYLLSVSRDRTWCLFEQSTEENKVSYRVVARTDENSRVHSRIIWSCAWTMDESYFFTASRDKKVVAWGKIGEKGEWLPAGSHLDVGEPVTAVAVSSVTQCHYGYLMSIGTDSGKIHLYNWSPSGWMFLNVNEKTLYHTGAIRRLRWRPCRENNMLYLASCSTDNCVKIYEIEDVLS